MGELDLLKLRNRVAALLAPWDRPDSPGASVGVVREGALVVQASAGMASLELGVKLGPQSRFRIASVSKQFTCAAVMRLVAEGRVAVTDAVQQYFPELPQYEAPVTIDHLMHNTSGLRDMLQIMQLGGCDLGVPVRPKDLLAGIARQRTLNFAPGSRYLYSNSNFLLLGLLVERVTGTPLRDYLATHFFAPQGMTQTAMVETVAQVEPNLATGYLAAPGGGWVRAQHGFPIHGEGALVSSVADLALWHLAYETDPALAASLEAQSRFPTEVVNHYARGLMIAEVGGLRTISHGGLWPGYRTEFLRVPEIGTGIIVITNCGSADAYQIGQSVLEAVVDRPLALAMPQGLERFVGRFLDPATPQTVEFALAADGSLTGTSFGLPFQLRANADGSLRASRASPDFTAHLASDDVLVVEEDAGIRGHWQRVADGASLPADLAGTYRSDEMAAEWTIALHDGTLRVAVDGPVRRTAEWDIVPISPDVVRFYLPGTLARSWMEAQVERDAAGAISGLLVNSGRVKRLALRRL